MDIDNDYKVNQISYQGTLDQGKKAFQVDKIYFNIND